MFGFFEIHCSGFFFSLLFAPMVWAGRVEKGFEGWGSEGWGVRRVGVRRVGVEGWETQNFALFFLLLSEISLVLFSPNRVWPKSAMTVSRPIDIPIIIDAFLLLDIQIRMCSSGNVNVLQWNWE